MLQLKVFKIFTAIALAGLFLGGCSVSSKKSMRAWHTLSLTQEMHAQTLTPKFTWSDYQSREQKLFAEMTQKLAASDTLDGYRYEPNSKLNPTLMPTNWNKSFALRPATLRGGVLLIHGLSDSPYSMRKIALTLEKQGFYALVLRMPGHGTLPNELTKVNWKDWQAAVALGAREVKSQLRPDQPFYILGYSNGGALAVNYSLNALEQPNLPHPDKLVLFSPMIGVSPFAGLSRSLLWLGHLPGFESDNWLDVSPEYNPFKYNSFPTNAGLQAHLLSQHIKDRVEAMAKKNKLETMPPILTFQSIADATVRTKDVVTGLYDHLPHNNSELILFDVNRHKVFTPITKKSAPQLMAELFNLNPHNYNLVAVTNVNSDSLQVEERRINSGAKTETSHALNLAFPPQVYSLSHVAMPFSMDDPLYGLTPTQDEFYGIRLGNLHLSGENNTVIYSPDANMRLYSNPFYSYVEDRLSAWLN